ncbi:MAG: tetratricopeptide repeat protein [Deltaproteobacteria bacterium]|nr:tetratricopeptide repeat protein [Deltaproteobacteria bacterium]
MDGGSESQELRLLRANFAAAPRSDAFVALAQHLCDVGRPEEAEQVCRKALAGSDPAHRGRLVLARALADRGRVKEAQDVLAELAKHRTDDAEVWVQLSALVVRRGEKARALALLEYAETLGATGPAFAAALSQARGGAGPRHNTMPPAIPKEAQRRRSTPPPDDRPRPVAGELLIRVPTPHEATILVPRRRPNPVWLVAGALSALAIATAWMLLHG